MTWCTEVVTDDYCCSYLTTTFIGSSQSMSWWQNWKTGTSRTNRKRSFCLLVPSSWIMYCLKLCRILLGTSVLCFSLRNTKANLQQILSIVPLLTCPLIITLRALTTAPSMCVAPGHCHSLLNCLLHTMSTLSLSWTCFSTHCGMSPLTCALAAYTRLVLDVSGLRYCSIRCWFASDVPHEYSTSNWVLCFIGWTDDCAWSLWGTVCLVVDNNDQRWTMTITIATSNTTTRMRTTPETAIIAEAVLVDKFSSLIENCVAEVEELVMNEIVVLRDLASLPVGDKENPWLGVAGLVVVSMVTSFSSPQALTGLPVPQTSDGNNIHYHLGENLLIANEKLL